MSNMEDARAKARNTRTFINLLTNKWVIIIIHNLGSETKRYNEIRKSIGDVTQKVLTDRLRQLERDGIIKRTIYPVAPLKVEYKLTHLGLELLSMANDMARWAEVHQREIKRSQKAYEKRMD